MPSRLVRDGASGDISVLARSALPKMPVSRLLKSWAMPPASTPRLSSFLTVEHLLLEIALFRDVAAHGQHHSLATQIKRACRDLHGANPSIPAPQLELQPVHALALGQLGVHGITLAGLDPRRQLGRVLAHDLLARVSHRRAKGVVASDDRAVLLGQGHGAWNQLENAPKTLLRLAQSQLLESVLGDVLDDADHGDRLAGHVSFQLAHAMNPANAVVVGANDAVATVEVVARPHDLVDHVAMHVLAVIGMNQAEPAREIAVEHVFDAQKNVECV
jgi:hypothetical protein